MTTENEIREMLRVITQKVDDIPARLAIRGDQIRVTDLAQINRSLGLVMAGEFRVGNGKEIGRGFTGGRFGWPQFWYNNNPYFLVGINDDVLEIGLDALTGKLTAGAGNIVIGQNGISTYDSALTNPHHRFFIDDEGAWKQIGTIRAEYLDSAHMAMTVAAFRNVDDPDYVNLYLKAQDNDYTTDLAYIKLDGSSALVLDAHEYNIYNRMRPIEEAITYTTSNGGSVNVGEHRYTITAIDNRGKETSIQAEILSMTVTAPNQTVNLTIPTGHPTKCIKRRIYRTPANSADFYKFVAEINDNTTTTYVDTAADSSLGAYMPTVNRAGVIKLFGSGEITSNNVRITPDVYHFAPKAPVVSLVASAGNVNNGTHSYIVTFSNGTYESASSPASNIVTCDASHGQVTIPLEIGPYGTTQRRIYRSTAGNIGLHALLAIVANNTATSYTDNIADASLITTSFRPSATTLGRSAFPGLATFSFEDMVGTAQTEIADYAQLYAGYWQQSGTPAVGDYWRVPIYIEAGTYTLSLRGVTDVNAGQTTVYLDNVQQGSAIEWYSDPTVKNVIKTVTVTIAYPGYHVLEIQVTGKHASSSNYYCKLTRGQLKRAIA